MFTIPVDMHFINAWKLLNGLHMILQKKPNTSVHRSKTQNQQQQKKTPNKLKKNQHC